MEYSKLEDMQRLSLGPITSDYLDEVKGFRFQVVGIRDYAQKMAIDTEIADYVDANKKGALKVVTPEETFVPTFEDIVAACWAAACVQNPAVPSYEWLKFARNNSKTLFAVYWLCLLNSREIGEEKAGDGEDLPVVEAAEVVLNNDPLELAG